jgi:hypothetical protein
VFFAILAKIDGVGMYSVLVWPGGADFTVAMIVANCAQRNNLRAGFGAGSIWIFDSSFTPRIQRRETRLVF